MLVDEINRASPKTQSGLLECMQERHVTVDVHSHELASPFMVFATQNPVEYEGTYPLPEAQVDRFMVRLSLGYPTPDDEAGMLAGHESGDRVLDLEPVVDHAEVLTAQDAARRVHASRALRDYVVTLLRHTRDDTRVELGASPRAGLMLLRAAKAHALVNGRDHALPDDVQALAPAVLSHRIMLVPEAAGVAREQIVTDAVAADPGALGAQRALRPRLRGARGPAAAGRGHVRRGAAVRDRRRRSSCSARAQAAWIGLGAWGATVRRTVAKRSVVEEEPLAVRIEALRGRLPLPPGWIDEPLLPEPVRLTAGRSRARVRAEVTFARRGRRLLAPPALVLRDPFGLAQRVVTGPQADEVLVLPRVLPVRATAGGGEGVAAHAAAALVAAAETEIDGLREHREGSPASRIHWPTVARGAGLMERKLISEADSRPLVVLDPRGARLAGRARRRSARGRLASPSTSPARPAAAWCCRATAARSRSTPTCWPGPQAHVRLALMEDTTGPALTAAQNRRGLVVFVAARIVDRPPRGLGRTPGGCLIVVPGAIAGRSAVLEVAGCQGFVAGRTGSAAVMAAVGGAA